MFVSTMSFTSISLATETVHVVEYVCSALSTRADANSNRTLAVTHIQPVTDTQVQHVTVVQTVGQPKFDNPMSVLTSHRLQNRCRQSM